MLLLEPSSSTSPSSLLDQGAGDVIRSIRVMNAEVPLFSVKIGVHRDLNRFEYDSLIRVLVTLPSRGLQGYEDALPSLVTP